MNQSMNKLIKENVEFHNSVDGLWDIGIAMCFLLAGASFMFNAVAYAAAFYFFIFLLMKALKKKYTYTRIGFVNHKGMKSVTMRFLLAFNIIGILFLGLGILTFLILSRGSFAAETKDVIQFVTPLIVGTFLSVIVFTVGKIFGIRRFYYYSVLIVVTFFAIKFNQLEFTVSLLICGFIIFIIGIVTFIKFLRKYPKLEDVDIYE